MENSVAKPILQASIDKLRRYLVFRFFIELFNYDIHNFNVRELKQRRHYISNYDVHYFNVRYTSENEHENWSKDDIALVHKKD